MLVHVLHLHTQQQVAGQVLTQFKEHPESWTRVDTILELSDNQKTKVGLCTDVRGREGGGQGILAPHTHSLFVAHCVHHKVWVAE